MGATWSSLETKTATAGAPALPPLAPCTVLQANQGGERMERARVAKMTIMTAGGEGGVAYALPTERRYVELGVTEFEGASKLEARFDLGHVALGVALDRPFRVSGLTLVCEAAELCGFADTLDWVETPTGAGGAALRVYGDAVPALLVDTGDARLHVEANRGTAHRLVYALSVPFGGAETMMWSGADAADAADAAAAAADHKRYSVRAAAKDVDARASACVSTRMHLVVELLVGEAGANAIVSRGMRSTFCIFRAPVEPGSIEVDVPLDMPAHGMLRSLTAAVPKELGVARITLTLDGHELVGAPGLVAALAASRTNLSHKLLHLPLARTSRSSNGDIAVSGELHLDAPAVRAGRLALRITLKPPPPTHTATPNPDHVHVHVSILG
jgi:hypothetical protein